MRNETTGVLYVLDEPSIGLHPSNVDGLLTVMRDLLAEGNSVVLVDHDIADTPLPQQVEDLDPGPVTRVNAVDSSQVGANVRSTVATYSGIPALSGGEAQRLKLASELGRDQSATLFVFDEPSIGLHLVDARTLLNVLQRLVDNGATVLVIEHDLDLMANADYIVDMGPGGGAAGGTIVATGTPDDLRGDPRSLTGRHLDYG